MILKNNNLKKRENITCTIDLNNLLSELDLIELYPEDKLSFKYYTTDGFHISKDKFIYLGTGILSNNSCNSLDVLNVYFEKVNAVFKNRFNLNQGFIKCKLNEGGDLNIILYAEKPNITWGDLHDYLDLLKDFINAEITIDLPKYNKNATLEDLSLSQIDFCIIDAEEQGINEIIRFLDLKNDAAFFLVINSYKRLATNEFETLYSIIFLFTFIYKEYIGSSDTIKEIVPENTLLVYYISGEIIADEGYTSIANTVQLVQMLPNLYSFKS